ncbi:hypothetical protein [Vibrio maritimus]|uniref:hypothetical protein n=1 Tax=Vibrio maritimus TaxID=990268 RepID=UPI001F44EDE4|nr:hypothetical protein [Vibrio maritimus]
MPQIQINWLSPCTRCQYEGPHQVNTNSSTIHQLNTGDTVSCGQCQHTGCIEQLEAGVAECYWAEVT